MSKVIKIHCGGDKPVAPLEGSRGFERVEARGCSPGNNTWGHDDGDDCGHGYGWTCDECPALPALACRDLAN